MNMPRIGIILPLLALSLSTLAASPGALVVTCLGLPANIVGNAFSEQIVGGAGNDVINGMGGDDRIYGGGGNDVICGDEGDDLLDGEAGNDLLNGGPGDDHFFEQAARGIDTADYRTSTAGVIVFLDNSQPSPDGLGGADRFDNVENVYGSAFNDQLNGDDGNNLIRGREGNDLLRGARGNDRLEGGTGADTASGGPGNDTADGGPGADTCTAEVQLSC